MIFCKERRSGKWATSININKGYKMANANIDIEEKVINIVSEKLNVDSKKVVSTASFVNDLGADSLDIVEIVMEVEKEFNINIPDEESTKLITVGDAIEYIEAHV